MNNRYDYGYRGLSNGRYSRGETQIAWRINKDTGAKEHMNVSGGFLTNSHKRDGWQEPAKKGGKLTPKKKR